MATENSPTNEPRHASSQDYARQLKAFVLPQEQKPYIMARFALASYGTDRFGENAYESMVQLKTVNDEEVLEPPLSEELREEIDFAVDKYGKYNAFHGPAAGLILAWVLENASANGVPYHRHPQELIR